MEYSGIFIVRYHKKKIVTKVITLILKEHILRENKKVLVNNS